jgi:GDP/UDP-N,N'-diacetylbacillosamine 2-epimerase (hydrolysing)
VKKKIIFISAGRSDFDRFYSVLEEIKKSKKADLFIYLTSAYYNKTFGKEAKVIKKNFKVLKSNLKNKHYNDTPFQMIKNLSSDVKALSNHLRNIKPDLILIISDRYEMLVGPLVAIPNNIPTFHFFGGAVTEGAIDELIRHSLTKMSHYHFVLLEDYKIRLKQLGEEEWRVKTIGMPNLKKKINYNFKSLKILSKELKFNLEKPFMLVTFHPITLELNDLKKQLSSIVKAIKISKYNAVITYPNTDPKFKQIIKIFNYNFQEKKKFLITKSLGEEKYFNLMKYAKFVLGNSSSGIVEAASFKLPVINIGSRQDGKFMPKNVINTSYTRKAILKSIRMAVSKGFKKKLKNLKNPYNSKMSEQKSVNIILNTKLNKKLLRKKFNKNY